MNSSHDSTLDIAHGDRGLSNHLKASMRLLAERSSDPEFKAMIKDAFEGRRSLRELATSGTFERALSPLVASYADTYRGLSEEEREEMAVAGQRQLDDLGETRGREIHDERDEEEEFNQRSILRSEW